MRRTSWDVIVVGLVLIGLSVWVATFPWRIWRAGRGSPINQATCDRILKGMSDSEVAEIMGMPWDDRELRIVLGGEGTHLLRRSETWRGSQGRILVRYADTSALPHVVESALFLPK